jgi:hypothetical protein
MKKKKIYVCLFLLLLSFPLISLNSKDSKGWGGELHRIMITQAVHTLIKYDDTNVDLPDYYDAQILIDLFNELDANTQHYFTKIKEGSNFEDSEWYYQMEHGWCPDSIRGFFINDIFGIGAAKAINNRFMEAVHYYRGDQNVPYLHFHPDLGFYTIEYKDYPQDFDEAWKFVGRAVHLLQDVCMPHHARCILGGKHTIFEQYCNSEYSSGSFKWSSVDSAIYNGYSYYAGPPQAQYIENSLYDWVDNAAGHSKTYYDDIEDHASGSQEWEDVADELVPYATRLTAGLIVFFWCYINNLDLDMDGLLTQEELTVEISGDYSDGTKTNYAIRDSDDDYMPDGWEVQYGLNPLVKDDHLDEDSDLIPNLEEYIIGTDPSDEDTDGDSLLDGDEVGGVYAPTHPRAVSGYIYGCDPTDQDTDSDLLDDDEEIFGYYHPENSFADANGFLYSDPAEEDTDQDQLRDDVEIKYFHTNPLDSDSDGDSIDDYEELTWGSDGFMTNPILVDTDGDGLSDYQEIHDYGTNPTIMDSDSDSFTDYDEIFTYGTDPLDQNSNPALFDPNICRNFRGLPDGIRYVYFTWNAPTNYFAGTYQWSAWIYVLKIKIGTTWTTIYSGTSRSKNYYPPSATTNYSYRLYCYNPNTGVYSSYVSWYGKAKSSGGGGGPM